MSLNNPARADEQGRRDPLSAFRFVVGVDGAAVSGAFTKFSGLSMRVDTAPARSGDEPRGVLDSVPGLVSYGDVRLSRGIIGDNEFMDWILSVAPSHNGPASGVNESRSITVTAIDQTGRPAIRWTLYDAMPVAYELSEMDASRGEYLSESVTFEIGGFRRETLT